MHEVPGHAKYDISGNEMLAFFAAVKEQYVEDFVNK